MSWFSSWVDNTFGTNITSVDAVGAFNQSSLGQAFQSIDWNPTHSSTFSEVVLPAFELMLAPTFALGAHYGVSTFGDFDRYLRQQLGGVEQASWINFDADYSNTWTEAVVPTLNAVGAAAVGYFAPYALPLAVAGNKAIEQAVGVGQGTGWWAQSSSAVGGAIGAVAGMFSSSGDAPSTDSSSNGSTPPASPGGPAPMPPANDPSWMDTAKSWYDAGKGYYDTGKTYYDTATGTYKSLAPSSPSAGPTTTTKPVVSQVPAQTFYGSPTLAPAQGSSFAGAKPVLLGGLALAIFLTLKKR